MNKDYEEYLINLRDKINSYDTPEADFDALIRLNDAGAYIRDLENNYKMIINEQVKKQKEVFDKIREHCEIEINASNHYLKNHSSQKELCHKVAHQRVLDILKEVE